MMFFQKYRRAGLTSLLSALVLLASGYFFTQCNSSNASEGNETEDLAYSAFISAYTSGVISASSDIRVRLVQEIALPEQLEQEVPSGVLSFSPSINGKAYFEDAQTIRFEPESRMPSGQEYRATIALDQLTEVPRKLSEFEFNFSTITQNFEVRVKGVEMYDDGTQDLTRQKVLGVVTTADYMDSEQVEMLLQATQEGKSKNITWEHADDGTSHRFTVEDVRRAESESNVALKWDGDPIDIDTEGQMEVKITAMGDFSVTDTEVVNSGGQQYVSVRFSEPLKSNQNLVGLITLSGLGGLNYTINGNEVKVYLPVPQSGDKELTVSAGIKNVLGYGMKKTFSRSVSFRQVKPDVRFASNGTILPSTDGLKMPFEAVNLRSVEVTIVRIFEENVGQFLQVNSLSGSREIKRVGRPVFHRDVPLSGGNVNLSEWQRFSLDLTKLIKTEPGAIYQVELSFRRDQSAYFCEGQENTTDQGMTELGSWDESDPETESSYWDYADEYYNYEYYDWSERDDPCTDSYYIYKRRYDQKKQNILASDIGLIAKRGTEGDMLVFATDLRTTEPLQGVNISLYNYQHRSLGQQTTDGEGLARFPLEGAPFMVTAQQNEQRGYLKLDPGLSLSVSNFDVSGTRVQEGLKGMIYGERGVWRPGDTLFMMFILEDELDRLPKNHPVMFELVNPMGQTVDRQVKTDGMNGFFRFTTRTATDAPTGNWMARVRVGGATFSKSLPIETVKPNRLKIKLDFGVESLSASDPGYNGNLNVTWLHGAKAGGLKARFKVTLTAAPTNFPKYSGFEFDDPTKSFGTEERVIFDDYLNDDGEAVISGEFSREPNAPGRLQAFFRGQVFEEGGDFSIDQFSIPYYPFSSFVGVQMPKGDAARGMLLTDTTHTVQLRSVTPEGEPSPNRTLELRIYKLNWRWWWDRSSDDVANYMSGRSLTPVSRGTITTNSRGEGTWNFRIDYPEWGRYVVKAIDKESGHSTGQVFYIDWPGWAGRAQRDNPGGDAMLMFGTDKSTYQLGEKVNLSIPTSGQGRALVSLETGSKVLRTYWVNTQKGETKFSFETTSDMAPNVYIHVTLLQPHHHPDNDLPIRLYGVTPIKVEDPGTILKPVLAMADEIRPESEVTLEVSEEQGKAMTYTVAVVDEGLLDLTRYRTPNPWNTFYAREALGVNTWDLFQDVIGAYGGDLERILAIGGDDYGDEEEGKKDANRFKPVVRFFGPFTLKSGGTNEHTFKMPPYVGSVKTMIIAGQDGAYGITDKAVPVRKPLMALATLPRVLGPEETVKLPVNIFTLNDDLKNVTVTVETNDLLQIQGDRSKTIRFSEAGDQIVEFDLKTAPKLGVATVRVVAKSGREEATYDIELNVRNPNPMATNTMAKLLEGPGTWNTPVNPVGMEGTNTAVLEISRIPPIDLGRRLKYLIRYPHGCIEQTTSSVFPQLYLADLVDLPQAQRDQIEVNIKKAIQRLMSFQTSSGGFSYWPGGNSASDWGTNYAGHFLLEAKARGYNVPDNLLRNWRNYQRNQARDWRGTRSQYRYGDLIQAYRLYTLALSGNAEQGAMNRFRETSELTLQAKWRLAAAYAASGKSDVAEELINGLGRSVQEYTEMSGSYGSNIRDEAMILETLVLLNRREEAVPILQKLSDRMSDQNRWMSTQTTAYCLLAVGKFAANNTGSNSLEFEYAINGARTVKASTELPVVQIEIPMEGTQPGKVMIENTNQGTLYARVISQGQPLRGNESASEENVRITVMYKDLNGSTISVDNLKQGEEFLAEVVVYNPGTRGHLEEMALTQIFPSGWEIINTRLNGGADAYAGDTPDFLDIRDDRVYHYFDLREGQRKTFRVRLNAAYEGKFYLPSVNCEAMYDNTINARTVGREVLVRDE